MAQGWLRLVADDVVGARQVLAQAAPGALHAGRCGSPCGRSPGWRGAGFALGDWDEAAPDAERAVSLLEESGHGVVAAARAVRSGDGAGRSRGVGSGRGACAGRGGSTGRLRAHGRDGAGWRAPQVPAARGDHEGVLRALTPCGRADRAARCGRARLLAVAGPLRDALVSADGWTRRSVPGAARGEGSGARPRLDDCSAGAGCADGWRPPAERCLPPRPRSSERWPRWSPWGCRSSSHWWNWPTGRCCDEEDSAGWRPSACRRPGNGSWGCGRGPTSSAVSGSWRRAGLAPAKRSELRPLPADRPGAGGGTPGGDGDEQPAGGVGVVRQHQDGAVPPHPHLRETRGQLPCRARCSVPRQRDGRPTRRQE